MDIDQNHLPVVHVPVLSDPEGLHRTLAPEGLDRDVFRSGSEPPTPAPS